MTRIFSPGPKSRPGCAGKLSDADIEHIAEEIESMGRAEERELVNRLSVLLVHLLKWRFQPSAPGTSWRLTIEEQRHRLADHLLDNPSLKASLDASIAAREAGLDRAVFPAACPWSFEQVMDGDFWPEHS